MNSAVILKIEYKFEEADQWSTLTFISESAKLDIDSKKEKGNKVYNSKISFKISKNTAVTVEPILSLFNRRALYRFTDGNSTKYYIGTNDYKASLEYGTVVDGKPGGLNGREVTVTNKSPYNPTIE